MEITHDIPPPNRGQMRQFWQQQLNLAIQNLVLLDAFDKADGDIRIMHEQMIEMQSKLDFYQQDAAARWLAQNKDLDVKNLPEAQKVSHEGVTVTGLGLVVDLDALRRRL